MITTEEGSNKTLLTLGCSFLERSWDDEKPSPDSTQRKYTLYDIPDNNILKEKRLSTLLAKELNRKDINLARSGQSNTRALEVGIDYIKNHRFDDIKVLVGFTEFARFNYHNHLTGNFHKVTPHWNTLSQEYPQYPLNEIIEEYFTYYYNEDVQINSFINKVLVFDSFCKLRNIDVVYLFAYETFNLYDNLIPIKDKLYTELVCEHNINLFNFNSKDKTIVSWPEYILSYDDTYVRGHPIIDDNYKLLDLIKPYFSNKLI